MVSQAQRLSGFRSFLCERTFFVSLGSAVSQTFDFDYGVPQGSILCPIIFSLHTLLLENTVKYHCYADDILMTYNSMTIYSYLSI